MKFCIYHGFYNLVLTVSSVLHCEKYGLNTACKITSPAQSRRGVQCECWLRLWQDICFLLLILSLICPVNWTSCLCTPLSPLPRFICLTCLGSMCQLVNGCSLTKLWGFPHRAVKHSRNIKQGSHKPCSAERICTSSLLYQDSFTTQTRF